MVVSEHTGDVHQSSVGSITCQAVPSNAIFKILNLNRSGGSCPAGLPQPGHILIIKQLAWMDIYVLCSSTCLPGRDSDSGEFENLVVKSDLQVTFMTVRRV